jgi:exosortase/archaeosortase family protein
MIKILGIPVYRDGMYIQIPNGNFVVAEACSGIRFLISTITIGVLYSYLNFTKLYKQILFVLICCAVAIIGNGLRAFLIILIGHLSDMKAAVGFDHLVYGWVFFAFIMGLIFVIGHYMSDPITELEKTQVKKDKSVAQKFPSLIFTTFTLLVLFLGPLLKYQYEKNVNLLTEQIDKSSLTDTDFKDIPKFDYNWIPSFPRADEIYISKSTSDNVEIFIAKYYAETDDKEIISYQNRFFDEDLWSLKSISSHEITDISDNNIPYTSLSIVNIQGKERTIRVTYKVNNMLSANKIEFKLLQLTNKIMMTDFGGEVIVLSSSDPSNADNDLDKFMYEGFFKVKQHTILIE